VAERLKAADCKSVLYEYVGSNPASSTIYINIYRKKRLSLSFFKEIIRHLKFGCCNSGSYSSAVEHLLGK
jgi:hypothetical protein